MTRLPGLSFCGALLAFIGTVTNAAADSEDVRALLSEARWAHADTDLVRFLTTAPGECLRKAQDANGAYLNEVGRAAFRSPLLFGGVAARSGLSCNSCHLNGRDNPGFFLEGLSGAPGTSDVTSSLFSKTREDGVFNPVVIPSLLDVSKKSRFGTTTAHPSIEEFVKSAVEDEFQGVASDDLVKAVSSYVAHLDSGACPGAGELRDVHRDISDIRRTLVAAKSAIERGENKVADFLFGAARHGLGFVYERYQGSELEEVRKALTAQALEIAELRAALQDNPKSALAAIPQILKDIALLETMLAGKENLSLYSPEQLRRIMDSKPTAG